MCGIVGARDDWLRRRGLEPASALRAAVAAMAWRGPDGQCAVRAGDWWLGCARLAIGPAQSRQPVVRRGGRFAGVANGAITNARELWARLRPGLERRTALPNDAWLPLLAVEAGDAELLAGLRGHHAYAVVDTVAGTLVFGRDRYGEKPFGCVVERAGAARELVAFASTRPALAAFGVRAPFAQRRAAEWFRSGWAERDGHRFSARCALATVIGGPFEARGEREQWYRPWQPRTPARRTVAQRPGERPVDPARALAASVARCLDTAAPAALSLSGGIDSSCIAAAWSATGRRGRAYQFQADGSSGAERATARAVADRCGFDFRPVGGGPELLDALPRLTALAGVPLGDPSILAVHATARAAAGDGVRVLLSGEGADELFLGYRRYRALARLPHLPWLRALAPRWSTGYAARWLRAAVAADPAGALLAVTPPAFGDTVLSSELAGRRCWRDAARPAAAVRGDRVLAARERDLAGYLRHDLLPKVDVATMAAAVEARCPFLEGDFLAFAADRGALGKRPLRRAFAGVLPRAVFRQPKRGFALPLDRWFRAESPWLDLLAENRTRQRPHLRPGGVAAAVDRHRSGRADLGHGLYLLIAFEVFLRWHEQDSAAGRTQAGPTA